MYIRKILRNKVVLKLLYHLRIIEFGFYLSAFSWHRKHSLPENITAKEILELFYLDFLKVPKEDCIVVEITEKKLITRCKNDCPILSLSLKLGIDTKKLCKNISEGPCKYFLRKIDKNIVFKRDYDHIRPYKSDCEETIIISNAS